jgi:hypothetical protein
MPNEADSLFALQVFAHDVRFTHSDDAALMLSVFGDPMHDLALAFQFLDYPLLLVYATGRHGPLGIEEQQLVFRVGKRAVLEAVAGQLEFLAQQVWRLLCEVDVSPVVHYHAASSSVLVCPFLGLLETPCCCAMIPLAS